MLTALLLSSLLSQTADPQCARGRCRVDGRGMTAAPFAFFEFAPTGGAGMTTACACTTPTGAKGEALTFTRTGAATCSRQGLATTDIADGDLVVCNSDNQPRVELSGGVLGLRVESARTNSVLRSQKLNDAVWASANSGVAAPTVTADQATAPDGTTTAERIEVPATTSGRYSYVYQGGFSAVQRVSSFYVKGNGGSGSINLLSGSTPNACVRCNYVADSWTRCELPSSGTASTYLFIGNDSASAVCGTSSKSAVDAFVWGVQHEAGTYPTSYIPTGATAVTRNAEAASFTLTQDRADTTICLAATVDPLWTASGQVPAFGTVVGWATPVLSLLSFPAGAPRFFTSAGNTGTFQAGRQRLVGRDDNTNITLSVNGTVTSVASGASADRWTTTLHVGSGASGAALDAIVSRVQADPSPSRCNP